MAAAGAPRLPAVIDVGPFRYSVVSGELERLRIERANRSVLSGHTDHDAQTLMVDTSIAVGQVRDTLLHETLHAIAFVSGLSRDWGTEREEDVVRRLSPLLLDTLRRNPALVAYITAEEVPA